MDYDSDIKSPKENKTTPYLIILVFYFYFILFFAFDREGKIGKTTRFPHKHLN